MYTNIHIYVAILNIPMLCSYECLLEHAVRL